MAKSTTRDADNVVAMARAAYTITDDEVLDADGFKRYRELAAAAIARCRGRFLNDSCGSAVGVRR
jgi:uncharacterized protein (DUF1330 family)